MKTTKSLCDDLKSCIDSVFKHPIVNYQDTLEHKDAKGFIDLKKIKEKVDSKEYNEVHEIIGDLEKMREFIKTHNKRKDENIRNCTEYVFELFIKQLLKKKLAPKEYWARNLNNTKYNLTELMTVKLHNTKYKSLAPSKSSINVIPQKAHNFSDREIQSFIKAFEMLQGDDHHKEMIRLLNEYQPDVDIGEKDIKVDVTRLATETFEAIRHYMRSAITAMGQEYPD